MRRLVFMTTLFALLVPLASWAQRSGMHSGSFAGHGGFASSGRAGVAPHGVVRGPAPAVFGSPQARVHFQGMVHPPFHPPGNHHHLHFHHFYPYFRPQVAYGYPYFYGGYYDPFYWDWYNSSSSYHASGDDYAERQTARQIDELSQEVQNLREERDYSQASPVPPPTPPSRAETKADNEMSVVIVLLDRRIQEVKNYAIANEMLLAFDDHRVKKIPLADIDLAATMKLNDERGVDFEVPNPTASE